MQPTLLIVLSTFRTKIFVTEIFRKPDELKTGEINAKKSLVNQTEKRPVDRLSFICQNDKLDWFYAKQTYKR